MKGWKLLSEKLKMLGVGNKGGTVENITEKKTPPTRSKKEKLPRNKILCDSGSGDKARSSF